MTAALLEVRDLRTHFLTRAGVVKAVEGVTFDLARGEILGLVGESGSGKSVTGFSLIGLVDPPGRIVGGSIRFDGQELVGRSPAAMRGLRGRRIAMVFQDPAATLNPVLTVGAQMVLAVQAHGRATARAARDLAARTLARVGIPEAAARLDAYPHEFSGGMRQRVAIATALLHGPELIIADEPTTALDVSIQAQILAEMKGLARDTGTALIWISHDLATVSSLADRVLVMYAGRIVESGPVAAVLRAPLHPYTRGLLDSLPAMARPGERLNQIPGSTPSLLSLPPGCPFAPRCPRADAACATDPPVAARPGAAGAVPSSTGRRGMSAILTAEHVTRRFAPRVSLGDRIAGALGARVDRRAVQAVTDVSLEVRRGETLGLVGESGCGKSTLGPHAGRHPAAERGRGAPVGRRADARAPQDHHAHPDRLPGSLRLAEPAHPHRRGDRGRSGRALAWSPARRRRRWWRSGCAASGSTPPSPGASRTSSPAGSASGSRSRARWPCSPRCWSATSRWLPWTCRSRRRS
jgi:oligopeptide/dipeptide ABC transporter ATP-binding protein